MDPVKMFSIIKKKKLMVVGIVVFAILTGLTLKEVYTINHLELNSTKIHTISGAKKTLKVNVNRKISWNSSNKEVAKINQDGEIICGEEGNAIITGSYLWKKIKCKIKVDNPTINTNSLSLVIGETEKIQAENTTLKVSGTADNNLIDYKDNRVTGINPGESGVTLIVEGKKLHCDIEVRRPSIKQQHKVKKGKVEKISTENWPVNTDIKWISSNEDIAKVEKNDNKEMTVKGINVGIATLTANINNQEYKTEVIVTGDQNLEIEGKDIEKGETLTLHINNFIDSYKVDWDGAKATEKPGEAIFEGKERGAHTVKATVNTGVKEEVISKEIYVKEKTLNMYEWSGSVGESFSLTMQDGDNPQYKFDETMLDYKDGTFTTKNSGETVIHVTDGKTDLACAVSVISKGDKVISAAEYVANIMTTNGFYYGNKGSSHNLDSALSKDKKASNCAIMASWVLQEAGLLEKGKIIHYNNGLKGSGASYLENSPLVEVTYPDTLPKDTNLTPGDVCGFMLNGKSPHVGIFAGVSDDGHLLWYTGGRDATDTGKAGGTYARKEKIGPRRQDYYDEICCLIHPK